MPLQQSLNWQRIQHIVTSYNLAGENPDGFQSHLQHLLNSYSCIAVEWCLVELIVHHWHCPPLPRGVDLYPDLQQRLDRWPNSSLPQPLSPAQFQQITGLSPRHRHSLPHNLASFPFS